MTTTPPPVIVITEQEALNAEAGWRTIDSCWTTGNDGSPRLITDNPVDPSRAELVRYGYGEELIYSVDTDTHPTHWMPVPVAKKAGVEVSYEITETVFDTEGQLPSKLTEAEISYLASIPEKSAIPVPDTLTMQPQHRKYFMGEFALILAAKGHAVDYQTLERLAARSGMCDGVEQGRHQAGLVLGAI